MSSNPMYMEYVDDSDPGPDRRRSWRVLGWVSIGLSAAMVVGSLTAYGYYWKLQNNINQENANALIGTDRPAKLNSAMNILLLGSDTRAGKNAKYGRGMRHEAPRSDTMILLHLSPGGRQAMGISFPRDLMVPIPSCKRTDGTASAAQSVGQLNAAFTAGGPTCVMKTIEQMSNIKIDHFMMVDFNSFKSITSAVGGVEVCLPKSVNDPKSGLRLSRGRHTLKGEQALAYVRNRTGLGDGSDLSRIKRQQQFMGSLAKKVMSAGTLTNPNKLMSLAEAGTKSLTTDSELNVRTMIKIAQGMQGLTAGKLRFVTVPNGAYAPDPNRVALRQPAADDFFSQIRNDREVAEEEKRGAAKVPPAQVRVRVYNASGVIGQAGRVAEALEAQGFQVLKVGNLGPRQKTLVMYGSGADQQAATLSGVVPGTSPIARANGTAGVVDLVLGADFTAVKGKPTGISQQEGEIRADQNICAQH